MEAAEDEDADSYPESFSASSGFLATGFLQPKYLFSLLTLAPSFLSCHFFQRFVKFLCCKGYSLFKFIFIVFCLKKFQKEIRPGVFIGFESSSYQPLFCFRYIEIAITVLFVFACSERHLYQFSLEVFVVERSQLLAKVKIIQMFTIHSKTVLIRVFQVIYIYQCLQRPVYFSYNLYIS